MHKIIIKRSRNSKTYSLCASLVGMAYWCYKQPPSRYTGSLQTKRWRWSWCFQHPKTKCLRDILEYNTCILLAHNGICVIGTYKFVAINITTWKAQWIKICSTMDTRIVEDNKLELGRCLLKLRLGSVRPTNRRLDAATRRWNKENLLKNDRGKIKPISIHKNCRIKKH